MNEQMVFEKLIDIIHPLGILMHINTETLAAFLEIQKEGSFTKAAYNLGIGQSAISQKIARLEELLHVSLFIRQKNDLRLTAAGEKLLLFAKQQLSLEHDFISTFNQYDKELSGNLTIAGYSSITQSVLIPKCSKFMRENPKCFIQFDSFEMWELIDVLKSAKADIIVTDYRPTIAGIESYEIFEEEFVVIESKKFKNVPDIYLDHGPDDNATEEFFKHQRIKQDYRRNFMGDVFGIIEAVKQGLGKSVMSKHLVENEKNIRILKSKRPYIRKVYISYLKQNYYSPLFKIILETLRGKN